MNHDDDQIVVVCASGIVVKCSECEPDPEVVVAALSTLGERLTYVVVVVVVVDVVGCFYCVEIIT